MKLTVKFFAQIREQLNCSSTEISVSSPATMADVKAALDDRFSQHSILSQPLLMACNQEIVDGSHPVSAGDELALFPPVTGG